jgi:DNA-binding LacI/PurR family transcriptional regulator
LTPVAALEEGTAWMETVPRTNVTIVDVASRAGVGVATVSRVLNGHTSVRPATRARVLDAIAALDYRPSSVARSLSLGKSMVVAVVLPWFTPASAIERVRGIIAGVTGSAYDVMLFDVESVTVEDPHAEERVAMSKYPTQQARGRVLHRG